MWKLKPAQFCILNRILQRSILKLGHFTALGTDLMMRFTIVISRIGKKCRTDLDNQTGVDKQNDGIVKCRTTDPEISWFIICE